MAKKIRILQLNVDGDLEVKEVPAGLETMQKIVGGWIECVRFHNDIDLWIDEEGLLKEKELNFHTVVLENGVVKPVHAIVGDVFFASNDGENTISLSDKQIELIKDMFKYKRRVCVVR